MLVEARQVGLFDVQTIAEPPPVRVVGVGGAGSRMASEVYAAVFPGVEVVCIDTDAASLDRSRCDRTVLLGAASMRGFGSAGDSAAVSRAVVERSRAIREMAAGAKCVVVIAGAGGGTGAAAALVAEAVRAVGTIVVGVAALPFEFEPIATKLKAHDALLDLRRSCDALVEVPQGRNTAGRNVSLSKTLQNDRRFVSSFVSTLVKVAALGDVASSLHAFDSSSAAKGGAKLLSGTATGFGVPGAVDAARECIEAVAAQQVAMESVDRLFTLVESSEEVNVAQLTVLTEMIEARFGRDVELSVEAVRSNTRDSSTSVSLLGISNFQSDYGQRYVATSNDLPTDLPALPVAQRLAG